VSRSWPRRRRSRVTATATLVAATALLAACGTASSPGGSASGTASAGTTETIAYPSTSVFEDIFNPFSPSVELPAKGMIYEPLFYFDTADAGKVDPWLATSYRWSNGGRTLTFDLRHGVKWNDGTPFTSADVAYTFNLLKSNPSFNTASLPIASATAQGQYTAVVNFSSPAYSDLVYAAGQTYILPAHIWRTVKDPATWPDPKPVGTGAYELSSVGGEYMTLTANPDYYLKGMPQVKTWRFVAYNGNTSEDLAIESGQSDWANAYIPNIQQDYSSKDKNYIVSDIPLGIAYLIPNMVSGPTTSLAVRQAISDAIDRTTVSKDVYNGYASATNPEGLLLPNFSEYLDPSLANAKFTYSAAAAKKVLTSAGYTMDSSGYFEKNGQQLTLTATVIGGYTDYVQDLQIMVPELQQAGIDLTLREESSAAFTSDMDTGNFQLLMTSGGYTPSAYVYYKNFIDSQGVPPIGKIDTGPDAGRYNNPTVNSLLSTIASTDSLSVQKQALYQIEQIFASQLPLIPLFDQQDEAEFNGNDLANIPSVSNPYAAATIYSTPDIGWTAMHLQLAK
jgi:peptide/nickel transport system substrate-binding protein